MSTSRSSYQIKANTVYAPIEGKPRKRRIYHNLAQGDTRIRYLSVGEYESTNKLVVDISASVFPKEHHDVFKELCSAIEQKLPLSVDLIKDKIEFCNIIIENMNLKESNQDILVRKLTESLKEYGLKNPITKTAIGGNLHVSAFF